MPVKDKHKRAYMECAESFAKCSNATRLKVGSVIVKENRIISCGYNAHAEHINAHCELLNGETDPRVRHSEKNALMGLIRSNQSAIGATMFCTHACCIYCAIDIVDAGVSEFIYKNDYRDVSGLQHLINAGVKVTKYEEIE